MTIGGILGLLAILAPVLVAWIYRKWRKTDDPVSNAITADDKFDAALAAGDADALSVQLARSLQNIEAKRGGPPLGSDLEAVTTRIDPHKPD